MTLSAQEDELLAELRRRAYSAILLGRGSIEIAPELLASIIDAYEEQRAALLELASGQQPQEEEIAERGGSGKAR